MDPLTAALIAKPATKLIHSMVNPIFKKLGQELSTQGQVALHRLFGSYERYLNSTVERHSYFNSIVFKNEQRKLIDFYLPLTLIQTKDQTRTKVVNYPEAEVNKTQNLLIVDTAGMGKTTLLKFLFLNCVEQEAGIPIFIELRKLSKKNHILDFILNELSDVEGTCKPELFFKLLESGDFVFFLDGYDEIPETERSEVTASIQQFIEKSSKNKFIITSRDELGLVAFSRFQRYTINPLQKQEAYNLLRKYADENLANTLISKLELPENSAIHEFLTNPLLTSLLFKSFEYKHIIPLKRHIFYRQVYEALYESHDLTKEGGEFQRTKKSGLDIDRLEQILRSLGAITYKASKTEFTREAALEFIAEAKMLSSERKASASNILHDLTHAVPLLIEDGNYIRWSHRSIQEYFSAQYLCKNTKGRQAEILLRYYNEEDSIQHTNLIFLCADIDRSAFDLSIGKRLATDLLQEFDSLYSGDAISENLSSIKIRKELMTGKKAFFVRTKVAQGQTDEESLRISTKIHNQMVADCGLPSAGSSLRLSNPGIGFVHTNFDTFINNNKERLNLPFIKEIDNRIIELDIVDPELNYIKIDDAPGNPLNAMPVFEFINTLINASSQWKFDSSAAKEYLKNLVTEEQMKYKAEPW